MNNSLVKVITEIRRCGKSYLLNNIFNDFFISKRIKNDHIIMIDLNETETKKFLDPPL